MSYTYRIPDTRSISLHSMEEIDRKRWVDNTITVKKTLCPMQSISHGQEYAVGSSFWDPSNRSSCRDDHRTVDWRYTEDLVDT